MKDKSEFNEEDLKDLIEDWHWDKKSHEFARTMGLFMLGFFEYLKNQNLSKSTRRRHESNCSLIGKFVADYGYYDEFTPEILTGKPDYISEFKRKVMNTNYMIESYKKTWRKLAKYALLQIEKHANNFDDDEIILDIVFEALREAYIDTDERLIVWHDGKGLTVDQSAERINTKNDFDIEVMKDCIMAWVEMDAPPQNMNKEHGDIFEKDLRKWVNSYYKEKQIASILEADK